jgi:UPF0716 protein FxsA
MLRVLWILLLLPIADLALTIFLYSRYGTPFAAWLTLGAIVGALLISRAKAGLRDAMAPLQGGQVQVMGASLLTLLASARAFFAGLLFLFPGVLSDIAAIVVLLLPGRVFSRTAGRMGPKAANDDVIEAEFHEVRESRESLEDQRQAGPRDLR